MKLSRFAARHGPVRPEAAIAALWIALLSLVVGYIGLKGETAMAELDSLDLVAVYALEP